jgi:hypothetical protein
MIGLCNRLSDLVTIDVGEKIFTTITDETRFNDSRMPADQHEYLRSMKRGFFSRMEEYKEESGMEKDTLLSLAFWYVWGHIELHFWPIMEPKNLFYCLRRIIDLLNSPQQSMVTPFTHHFTGFAAHVLHQLCDFEDTRDATSTLLDALDDTLSHLIPQSDTVSYDAVIRDTVSQKRASLPAAKSASATSPAMGLEHLANAAVNSTSNANAGASRAVADTVEEPARPTPPVNDSGIAAAAEAAAKAAQLHMGSAHKLKTFDPEQISQEGYLWALLG